MWCGQPQPMEVKKPDEPAPLPEKVACEYCGKEIKVGAKFCMWCGATQGVMPTPIYVAAEPEPVSEAISEPEPAPVAESEPTPEPSPAPVEQPMLEPVVEPVVEPVAEPAPVAAPKKEKAVKEKKEKKEKKKVSTAGDYVVAIISDLLIAFVTAMPFLPTFATGLMELGKDSKSLHFLTETIISLIGGWNNDIESGKNMTMVLAWSLRGLWAICAVLGIISIIKLLISPKKLKKFSGLYVICFIFNILFQALAQGFVFLCKATYSANVFGKSLPIDEIQFNVICIAVWAALVVLCLVVLPILKKRSFSK